MHITCRVCLLSCASNDAAILLCADCLADVGATRSHVESVYALSVDVSAAMLIALSVADIRRARDIQAAKVLARVEGTIDRWQRRYERTKALGDALSRYLDCYEATQRTRTWRDAALVQLDLAVEVIQ